MVVNLRRSTPLWPNFKFKVPIVSLRIYDLVLLDLYK